METTTAHKLAELLTMDNIAEHLEPVELNRIGNAVIRDVEIDLDSRKEAGWDKRNEAAMKAAMQVREPKDHPWPGASNVKYPLLTVAAIQFQARAYPAIVDGATLVKGRVLGDDAGKPKLDPMGQPIMQPATNGVPGIGDNGGPPLEPVWEVPPGQKRERAGRVAMQRIEAARRLFPQMVFDEEFCQAGLEAIGWYHEKRDDERGIGLGPEHDWSSHGADAFGLIAVARPLLIPRVHENDDDFEGWQADDGRSSIAGY